MSIEDVLKLILSLFQDVDKQLEKLQNERKKWERKQQEVLHYIENHNLDAVQRCKIVGLLKDIRYERRQVKNEIDVLSSIKDSFVDKYKNKFIEKDIILALKKLKEVHTRQANPTYKYQYLTKELEIRDEEKMISEDILNGIMEDGQVTFEAILTNKGGIYEI